MTEIADRLAALPFVTDRPLEQAGPAMLEPDRGPFPARGGPLRRLLPALGPHRTMFAVTTASVVLHHAVTITAITLGAYIAARVADGAAAADLTWWFVALGAAVAGRGLGHWAEMWYSHDLAFRLLFEFRVRMLEAIRRTAPGGILRRRTGDVAAAAMADVERLEWFYAHTAANVISAVVTPTAAVIVIATLDPTLALITASGLIAVSTIPFVLQHAADRQGARLRAELALLKSEAVDTVQGIRELTLFGAMAQQREHILHRSSQTYTRQLAYAKRAGLEQAVADILAAAAMIAVLALGAGKVADGDLSPVRFPVIAVLAALSLLPITELSNMLRRLGEVRASAERAFDIIDLPPNIADEPQQPARIDPTGVRFDHVTFRYAPDLPDAVVDVSFASDPGTTTALVGPSGAGKSTLAHLLLRFWDPTAGRVLLGGIPVAELPQDQVRQLVTIVPQDVYLFNASIRDNLLIARPDATPAQLEHAVHLAQLDEFIAQIPAGLDTVVGERGLATSGGQRQRIAIARALLRDSPVLILDEAVSNLDTENEQALNLALRALQADRTTIVIAHRLSTIASANKIVMIDQGQLIATGTHHELLDRCPAYVDLLSHQVDPT